MEDYGARLPMATKPTRTGGCVNGQVVQRNPLSLRLRDSFAIHVLGDNYLRVSFLKLAGSQEDIKPILDASQSLPLLETLQINARGRDSDSAEGEWYLPLLIVQGGAPRLRRLRLENLGFQHLDDYRCLNNLTHFELTVTTRRSMSPLPSLYEIYDLIQRSPQLERLRLHDSIAPSVEDQPSFPTSITPVALPAIRFLELWLKLADCTAILGFLRLPPSCSISISALPTPRGSLPTYAQIQSPNGAT